MNDRIRDECDDPRLDEALRLLRADEDDLEPRASVEASIMRSWDAQARLGRSAPRREVRTGWGWQVAMLAVTGIAIALMLVGRRADSSRAPAAVREPVDTTATRLPDVLTRLVGDPTFALDAETLQVVRVRVDRQTMPLLGFAVGDAELDGPIDIDMLVGEDGVARGMRRVVVDPFEE